MHFNENTVYYIDSYVIERFYRAGMEIKYCDSFRYTDVSIMQVFHFKFKYFVLLHF